MLPFAECGVTDGDTIYLAIHAKYADRMPLLLKAVAPSVGYLQHYRLFIIVFDEHLIQVRLFDEMTIDGVVNDVALRPWTSGLTLDPVVGVVLADHASFSHRHSPFLFLFSDGNVVTHWNIGTLAQVVRAIWLNEPTEEPLLTPFGERREIVLEATGVP